MKDNITSYPKKDDTKRFLIGKIGKKNLLCVGINPNTADSDDLDATSRNVKNIANNEGYDGWLLVNLYPRRKNEVRNLELEVDQNLNRENLNFIEFLLESGVYNIDKVWLAWGNDIEKRPYFKNNAIELIELFKKHDNDFAVIRKNKSGHPTHPGPKAVNIQFKGDISGIKLIPFDAEEYIALLKD